MPGAADAAIAREAARSHGVVTTEQLALCGLTPHAIDGRVRAGRLIRLHQGVFAVGTVPWSPLTRHHAAVLACGPTALLSHESAAALLGLRDRPPALEHVTVLRGRAHPQPGIRLHRPRRLDPEDRWSWAGIPVTTVARVVLDVAPGAGRRALDALVNEALARRLLTRAELRAAIARYPRHRGARRVAGLITGPMTRSALERRFRVLVGSAGLAAPEQNAMILGHEVDAWWPAIRLVVELDGAANHTTPVRISRDVAKQRALEGSGLRVVRFTWWDIERDGARTISTLRRCGVPAA